MVAKSTGVKWYIIRISMPTAYLSNHDSMYHYPKDIRMKIMGIRQELNMVIKNEYTTFLGEKFAKARNVTFNKNAVKVANLKLKEAGIKDRIEFHAFKTNMTK